MAVQQEGYTGFIQAAPDEATYFRSIILFGDNTASYKFALSQALLSLAQEGRTTITLKELASYFVAPLLEHVKTGQAQSTMSKSFFLDAAVAHLSGQINTETFHDLTARHAFRYVLDLFHRLPAGETSLQFYVQERQPRRLVLTDALLSLTESQRDGLAAETEARWSLVEHVWTQRRDGSLVNRPISYDPLTADLVLVPWRHQPRQRLTPLRPSLSGYQKGLCFYCFEAIDTMDGQACHVDHFFPWRLGSRLAKTNLNSVWNLVLACPDCNSGQGGKHDAIPVRRFLERLHRRNSYLIDSHHPLRQTLLQDTGTLPEQRWTFLKEVETTLLNWQPLRWTGLRETFPMF